MKMRIVAVTETESKALCAAGKYQTGVPLFWVRDGKTWADAGQMREWRSTNISAVAKEDMK